MFGNTKRNMAVANFAVERRPEGDAGVRLVLHGELDLASEGVLREALRAEERAGNSVVVVVDGLEYLDSTGIGVLLTGQRRHQRAGLSFTVTPGMGSVRHVLEITGALRKLRGAA